MMDEIRVLRLIEYRGPREWVEQQLEGSIKGTKVISVHGSVKGRITAVTLGDVAEILVK